MTKAYLSFVTNVKDSGLGKSIEILDLDFKEIVLTGIKFVQIGQIVLFVCSENDIPMGLYVINDKIPHQIWGKKDALFESCIIEDLTRSRLENLRASEYIIKQGYKLLSIDQMINNKHELISWESFCMEMNITCSFDWPECKEKCIMALNKTLLSDLIKNLIIESINASPRPNKVLLNQPIEVDITGYEIL
jgi:hypothetical protein